MRDDYSTGDADTGHALMARPIATGGGCRGGATIYRERSVVKSEVKNDVIILSRTR